MNIETDKVDKSTAVMTISGRLDTANAPLLERKIKQWGDDITELVLDFTRLDYISSMGLRVLLHAQKTMKEKNRRLVIKNMNDVVREVFELTGFINLMVQEEQFVVLRKNEDDCVILQLNGEMQNENIPVVTAELAGIKNPVTLILDMEQLTRISSGALRLLSQAIIGTDWEQRTRIRNASEDMQKMLKSEGLDKLAEQ